MNPTCEELLFGLALTKPPAERAAWLARECADDAALRQRLEALFAAHEQPDTWLATTADSAQPTIKLDHADEPVDDADPSTEILLATAKPPRPSRALSSTSSIRKSNPSPPARWVTARARWAI